MTQHSPKVQKLLTLNDPLETSVLEESAYTEFAESDVSDLLALAGDVELLALPTPAEGANESTVDRRVWGPAHALRTLGAIGAVKAIPEIVALLEKHESALLLGAATDACEAMGEAAIEPLTKVLSETKNPGVVLVAADAVAAIGADDWKHRDRAIEALRTGMNRAKDLSPEANAYLVTSALDLEALELTEIIEAMFKDGFVDVLTIEEETALAQLGRTADGPLRLSFKCTECGRADSRVVPHVYPHPDPAKCAREGWDGLVLGRVIHCYGCGAIDEYELDAAAKQLLMMGAARVMGGQSQPHRILPLEIQLKSGKTGRRPSEILEDHLNYANENPDDADAWRDYARACQFFDQVEDAIEAWDNVGDLDEEAFDAPFSLGMLYAEMEELEEAYEYFDSALSMLPECKDAPKGERSRALRIIAQTMAQLNDMLEEPQAICMNWQIPGDSEGAQVIDVAEIENWEPIGEFLESGMVTEIALAPMTDATDPTPLANAIETWKKRKKNPFAGRGFHGTSRKRRR
ncbi:MAG: hypothetical protein U0165_00305 [Polyangiaceae bacterium]